MVMLFNSALIREIRRKDAIRLADFAELLAVSVSHLSMLEQGLREPSLAIIEKLVNVTDIPVEKWLLVNSLPEGEEIPCLMRKNTNAFADMKSRLNREHRVRQKAEERVWELEQINARLMAEIGLRKHFEDIICAEFFPKDEQLKKLEKLALWTMEEGELSFDEILGVLRIGRAVLRNRMDLERRPYECRFADGGKIMASSPGEAALCLRCFDCKAFESGECLGYGDEKRPENIMEILDRLKANGVYDGKEQSRILEKHYDLSLSPRDIANIRYRVKNRLPVRDDVFYVDMRKDS